VTLLLVFTVTALLSFAVGWGANRRGPKSSEWWDGYRVGRDIAMRARSLGVGERCPAD